MRVFEDGKKIDKGPIRLWFLQKNEGQLRMCFISRSKKAVRRNRIRRKLKEGFRVFSAESIQEKPFDLIFMSDERLIRTRFGDIVQWMGELLGRIGIFNEVNESGEV